MKHRRIEILTATGRRAVLVETKPTKAAASRLAAAHLPEPIPPPRQRFRLARRPDGQPHSLEMIEC